MTCPAREASTRSATAAGTGWRTCWTGPASGCRPASSSCLTGPSGTGKSTLLSLLVRLVEPDSGRITIGGADIARIPLRGLRALVTLVPQDP